MTNRFEFDDRTDGTHGRTLVVPPPRSFIEMSQPDPEDRAAAGDELEAELGELALGIQRWQKSEGLSQTALMKRFKAGLGSDKTFNKILKGDFYQLSVGDQLINYRAVVAEMALLDQQQTASALHADLGQAAAVLSDLGRFIAQPAGRRRFFLIEGPSGSGKTSLLDLLSLKQPAKVLRMTGCQRWRYFDAFVTDLLALLPAIDRTPEAGKARKRRLNLPERMEEAGRRLLITSRVLVIDEAQCMTGAILTFLKDLINREEKGSNRLYIVAAGVSTLWQKLEENAEEETKQLKHNRNFRRVLLEAPDGNQCQAYLGRTLAIDTEDSAAAARIFAQLAQSARELGHWAFLRNVREALEARKESPLPLKLVAAAVARCRRDMGAD